MSQRRAGRGWVLLAGILALALALGLDVALRERLAVLADQVFDAFQRAAPRAATEDPGVVLVDIDEASLQRLGQWPWPRDVMGEMLDRLGQAGAAVVAFDMAFQEPDRTSLSHQLERLQARGVQITAPDAALDNDAVFAESIRRNAVVLGVAPANETRTPLPAPMAGLAYAGTDPRSYLPSFSGGLGNLPALNAAASGMGSFSFVPDADNIVRSLPLIAVSAGQAYPGLGVEALRVAQDVPGVMLRSSDASGESGGGPLAVIELRVGELNLPSDARGNLRVHYSGMPHMQVVPAWQALSLPLPELQSKLEGRVLLVGTSAIGLRDIVATPLSAAVPGMYVHAELIDQIFNGQYLQRPDWARGVEVLVAVLAGLVLLGVVRRGKALQALAAVSLLGGGALLASWIAYRESRWLLDPLPALLVVLLVGAATLPLQLVRDGLERRFVRSAFGRYLSPALVQRLSRDPNALKLGGEMREITVLFSDIRGFTTLSESLAPDELTELLNHFLTPMTEVLLAHEATIDKYIGDAIMAFWNAPIDIADHPRKACLAALGMTEAVARLNQDRAQPLRIGVGLHVGDACVGNLGSEQRFSYSAIGDTVNLAARVEGMSKLYGAQLLVTEAVRVAVPELAYVEVDLVRVVGRAAPVQLHVLLGDAAMATQQDFIAVQQAQAHFLALYRSGQFDAAAQALDALPLAQEDALAGTRALYLARLQSLQTNPPRHWDGIYTATSK